MTIQIKTLNIDMTDAIRQYVEEKLEAVNKMVEDYDSAALVEVEVGKSTNHHNKGPFMRCEFNMTFLGNMFRVEEEREDLYEAIDVARDGLKQQITEHKEKTREANRAPRPDKE